MGCIDRSLQQGDITGKGFKPTSIRIKDILNYISVNMFINDNIQRTQSCVE